MQKEGTKKIDGRAARRIRPEDYRKLFEEKVGEAYELMTEYERSERKITVRHKVCGSEFQVMPSVFHKHSPRMSHGISSLTAFIVSQIEPF